MQLALIGDLIEQEDGSAIASLRMDEEGKMYLMQLGLETIIMRYIEQQETKEKENV